MTYYFSAGIEYVRDIPVCASYCDDWFEACKNDMTCVDDWFANFLQALNEGYNTCPAESECMTFEEVFADGRGLCNRMWGGTLVYSEDEDNCTVMEFDPDMPNPNFQLSFPGTGSKVHYAILASQLMIIKIATVVHFLS